MIGHETQEGDDREVEDRLRSIKLKASERYGQGAEFAYKISGPEPKFAMLSLEDAITICGSYIAGEDDSMLWQILDNFYTLAQKILNTKNERTISTARRIGQVTLERHS